MILSVVRKASIKVLTKDFEQNKSSSNINSLEEGGDGGGPSKCDNKYHSDNTPVVNAMVVDECDSTVGRDSVHDYQPPCLNSIVDVSEAVWKALRVPEKNWVN
ncbi:unnamed protein product [Fraxinus pennsylvanica]|uniref:Uncharacterized protein n=1 Tax=Fraxinus pennsylvanica TaxID=56036 RepID=A0AAD2DVY6_9LAMI|nr:unnamed protein product [Fraxinus pennsylvanica]